MEKTKWSEGSPYWMDGGVSIGRKRDSAWAAEPLEPLIETYEKKLPTAWQCAHCSALIYIEERDPRCPYCGGAFDERCKLIPL